MSNFVNKMKPNTYDWYETIYNNALKTERKLDNVSV